MGLRSDKLREGVPSWGLTVYRVVTEAVERSKCPQQEPQEAKAAEMGGSRGGESQGKRMFQKAAKEGQCPGVPVALVRALCGQGWAGCGSQGFCAGAGGEDQGLREAEARGAEAEGRDASGGNCRELGDCRHGVCSQTSKRPQQPPEG